MQPRGSINVQERTACAGQRCQAVDSKCADTLLDTRSKGLGAVSSRVLENSLAVKRIEARLAGENLVPGVKAIASPTLDNLLPT